MSIAQSVSPAMNNLRSERNVVIEMENTWPPVTYHYRQITL